MKTETNHTFTAIEEIRIQLPKGKTGKWVTEITCFNNQGERVILSLTSVDRYANIWALTHNFEEMELIDLFDGKTKYEYGRYKLMIKNGDHVDQQWFMNATLEKKLNNP